MTITQIDAFVRKVESENLAVKISLKSREPFIGIFVVSKDYEDLKSKNFWRIIGQKNIQNYQTSKDVNLSRIYSGTEITSLKLV
ncbi:short-chain dehydrogenase [Pseudoflavitalea sp. G-6-1-2]|uniref:short-chain dehydrogenase n=1 Tax=Pseudoflavitalea sp. G-6-1-2 TaxID=2728841 RepID=UPI00146AFE72|nr:short-chain dehydrogenase [Pseudoflavitalea sp. G-6-1-2]NML21192.1 short-chain dehydrogenase [Pseudoflavitalea sp. G-6-1-2]